MARDFAAGRLVFQAGGTDLRRAGALDPELLPTLAHLAGAHLPESDAALTALTRPEHSQHAVVRGLLLRMSARHARHWNSFRLTGVAEQSGWNAHPYCLTILRQALDDTTPIGITLEVKDGQLHEITDGGVQIGPLPPSLANPKERFDRAVLTAGDRAAELLTTLVSGVRPYSPMRQDAAARRAELGAYLDRHQFRSIAAISSPYLCSDFYGALPHFEPEMAPLDRPATAADVAAGRAVFHLGGCGELMSLVGPTWVTTREPEGEESVGRVVQAELTADGSAVYGVLFPDSLAIVHERDVTQVTASAPSKELR